MDRSRFDSTLRRCGRGTLIPIAVVCASVFPFAWRAEAADPPLPSVQADFEWTPAVPSVGQAVTFQSTSITTGVNNKVGDYRWDVDGDRSNGYETGWGSPPAITTAYPVRGDVSVRLEVEDEFGNTSTTTKTVTVGKPPVASYTFAPSVPLVNEPVTFRSTVIAGDGSIAEQVWDLNGDGVYDNGSGPIALRTFPTPGTYVVGLRATDNKGEVSFYVQTVIVGALPISKVTLRQMSPFPVIRIAGGYSRGGVHVRLLSIEAPPGSLVQVRCKGRSCPFKRRTQTGGLVRLKRLEKFLRKGVSLRIYVTGQTQIGKYVVFKIHRGKKPPSRSDACLMPGSLDPIPCPSGGSSPSASSTS